MHNLSGDYSNSVICSGEVDSASKVVSAVITSMPDSYVFPGKGRQFVCL